MNEKEFQELLALLGLPGGSVVDDVQGAIRNMLATIHSVGADEDTDEARAVVAAATARLSRLSGEVSLASSVNWVEQQLAAKVELEKRFAKEQEDRKALEMGEYRALAAKLVALDVETPFSAWQDEKRTIPAKHLQAMSLPELRNRVKHFEACRKGAPKFRPLDGPQNISDDERKALEASGVDPAKYAAVRDQIKARSERAEG